MTNAVHLVRKGLKVLAMLAVPALAFAGMMVSAFPLCGAEEEVWVYDTSGRSVIPAPASGTSARTGLESRAFGIGTSAEEDLESCFMDSGVSVPGPLNCEKRTPLIIYIR